MYQTAIGLWTLKCCQILSFLHWGSYGGKQNLQGILVICGQTFFTLKKTKMVKWLQLQFAQR